MFIVWGTKRVEKKQGLVADFCPICRDVRSFELRRVGLAQHVYYISFGEGKLAGHIIQCTECGVRLTTNAMRYASVEKPRLTTDTETLLHKTFPNLRDVYAQRLAIEAQCRRSPATLTQEQRASLLIEPFQLLNPQVEARTRDTRFDRQSSFGCLGTMIFGLVLLAIAVALREPFQEKVLLTAGILFGLGTIYTLVQLGLGPGRFVRTQIVPALARSLDPIEPTQDELQNCLQKCRTAGMKIGKKLRLPHLWTELQRRAANIR
jgi:hypothetical protein